MSKSHNAKTPEEQAAHVKECFACALHAFLTKWSKEHGELSKEDYGVIARCCTLVAVHHVIEGQGLNIAKGDQFRQLLGHMMMLVSVEVSEFRSAETVKDFFRTLDEILENPLATAPTEGNA